MNQETFCSIPWINSAIFPNGNYQVCCNMQNVSEKYNINDHSLEEIINNDYILDIRKKMLNNELLLECSRCYFQEKTSNKSYRTLINYRYNHIKEKIIENKILNISLDNILMIDYRLNNKCNFRCKTCGPNCSSEWEKVFNKLVKYKIDKIKNEDVILQYIKEKKIKPDFFYFAGGESLISDYHWEIINFLIEEKNFDVKIHYNTNLSSLNYKGNNFIEKLKLFKDCHVSISCDSLGVIGEYIRIGFKHDVFIRNFNLLKNNNFDYSVTTVISFLNLIYLNDYLNDLIENKINLNVNFIVINDKINYDVFNLPIKVFNRTIIEIDKILNNLNMTNDIKLFFNNLKKDLIEKVYFDEKQFSDLISRIKIEDYESKKYKFNETLPELYELIKEYF